MHAIIRKGNGEYYISAIFGYYSDSHQEPYYGSYFVVFDEDKDNLIKQQVFNPETKPELDLMVLIVDRDESDWEENKYGFGGVSFLPKEKAMNIIQTGIFPEDTLDKCKELDDKFHYKEYIDIHNEADIEQLMDVSGDFHDAIIEKINNDGNVLYVLFDGVWGCKIEMFFEGDVSYNTDSRNPKQYDPYWQGSTMILQDGYLYFVDEMDMKVEDIKEGYCWFKAQNIRYHIIPN